MVWRIGMLIAIGLCLARPVSAWTLTAVGDIMFDRDIRTQAAKRGWDFPFTKIRASLVGDLVVGNLEGPITTHPSQATNTRLIFTFDPAVAPVLRQAGFSGLTLANNHTLNFGQAGLDTTRNMLQQAGLTFFGDPKNRHGFGTVRWLRGQPVALIGYQGLTTGLETVESDIREARAQGMQTIVFAHWGTEYQTGIAGQVQATAHRLIDAGADMIIGAHPHVIEPVEIYREKFIAYSLGNFVFDQYWSPDVRTGLLLHMTSEGNHTSVRFVPVVSVRGEVRIADAATQNRLLERLSNDSVVSTAQRAQIRSGILTL